MGSHCRANRLKTEKGNIFRVNSNAKTYCTGKFNSHS